MSPRMAIRRPRVTRPMPSRGSVAGQHLEAPRPSRRGWRCRRRRSASKRRRRIDDVEIDPLARCRARPAGASGRVAAPRAPGRRRAPRPRPSTPSAFMREMPPRGRHLEQERLAVRARAATHGRVSPTAQASTSRSRRPVRAEAHRPARRPRCAAASRIGVVASAGGDDRRRRPAPARRRSPPSRGRSPRGSSKASRCAGATVVISADMRARQPGQRRDLAGVVHADLDHREVGVARHPRQGQRHAPVVVEAGLGGMDPALRRQHRAQHLLGRGLADRAGHRDHARRAIAPARRAPSAASAASTSGTISSGASAHALGDARHQRRRRAPLERVGDEVMPVARVLQRDEEIARLQGCGVSIETPVAAKARGGAPAGRGLGLGGGPECAPSDPPVERGHRDAGLFGVVEGIDVAADDLPGLVPLAGDQQRVARAAAHRPRAGSPRRGRRSRSPRGSRPEPRRGSRRGPRCAGCRR